MNTRLDDNFGELLQPYFKLEDLEKTRAIVFGLWPDFRLAYFSPAWVKFAEQNGGQPKVGADWGLGTRYFDAIPEPLRPFYQRFLTTTADAGASMHPSSHVYECSAPTLFRKFSMQVYSLRNRAGFIIVNSLVVEAPHDPLTRAPHDADVNQYLDERGLVVQCSHCRLVRHAGAKDRWDWVPEWVGRCPANTSHGLCEMCFKYYYEAEDPELPPS